MKYKSLCCLFLLTVQCKKDAMAPQHFDTTSNSQMQTLNSNPQCYDPNIKLNLATETYDTPVVTNPSISSNFPRILNFDTNQLYDHINLSICAVPNGPCTNSYALSAPAVLPIKQLGNLQIKFEVCFNTTCSKPQMLMINNTNIPNDKLKIGSDLIIIADQLLKLAVQRLQLENNSAITPYVFLRMFKELYINQPQKLELANAQCNYTGSGGPTVNTHSFVQTSTQVLPSATQTQSVISTSTATSDLTSTETSTDTSTAVNKEKLIVKYLGLGGLVLSTIALGVKLYDAYKLNQKLTMQGNVFEQINLIIKHENPNFLETIQELSKIKGLPQNIKDKLISVEKQLMDIETERNRIKSDTTLEPSQQAKLNKGELQKINTIKSSFLEKIPELNITTAVTEEKYKSSLKGAGAAAGGLIISAGVTAYEYSLANTSDVSLQKIDLEIYNVLEEQIRKLDKY